MLSLHDMDSIVVLKVNGRSLCGDIPGQTCPSLRRDIKNKSVHVKKFLRPLEVLYDDRYSQYLCRAIHVLLHTLIV